MNNQVTYYRGTVEYVTVSIAADVDLDGQTVELSFDRETWYATDAVGDPGLTRSYQLLVGEDVDWPARRNPSVFVRIADNPEIPIKRAGSLSIL